MYGEWEIKKAKRKCGSHPSHLMLRVNEAYGIGGDAIDESRPMLA
jgi:hypothetical protein